MGVLTKYLLEKDTETYVVEIDTESVAYLEAHYPKLHGKILAKDFLKHDFYKEFQGKPFAITGNFPYNISTQIVFKMLEMRDRVPEFSGMFQKEVAERICEKKGSKTYGILSVLVQAFYDAEYLFTVDETRKPNYQLACSEKMLFNVVKTAFNQRRKTLRNSLKSLNLSDSLREDSVFDLRPEQLSTEDFIELTRKIEAYAV
jgi:16S rRNA (adenine1518-N6/adenine1519-N6)-dimethyltransferase